MIGCSDPRIDYRIAEIQKQLDTCQSKATDDHDYYIKSYNTLLQTNNNLVDFVDKKGTFQDKTAQLFEFYPWQSILMLLFLVLLGVILLRITIRIISRYNEHIDEANAKKINVSTKTARNELENIQNRLTHARDELNAIEKQRTALENELHSLSQYANIDKLKESARIIAEAEQKAQEIETKNNIIIAKEKENIFIERQKIEKLSQEIKQKELELEEIRRALIEG